MPQAKINNNTALAYEVIFANDEAFRPLVAAVVKATFNILPDGQLTFCRQQVPVNLAGTYVGDPESSSYIYEPECAFTKVATDVVVLGDAVSPRGPVSHLLVEMQIGSLRKQLGIIGNRCWVRRAGAFRMSEAEPFQSMPIIYENAFGGWDRRHPDPAKHGFEPRNTVGKGFYSPDVKPEDDDGSPMWLPNIETPAALIQHISDRPVPAGCGFTLPHWQPRARLAGTYDDDWLNSRSPLLPSDFDRRFFNAASESMVAAGYLTGDEPVVITNVTPSGRLAFNLPGVRAPVCGIRVIHDDSPHHLQTQLDTVIVDARNLQLQLIWRAFLLLNQGPHDVESIDIHYG